MNALTLAGICGVLSLAAADCAEPAAKADSSSLEERFNRWHERKQPVAESIQLLREVNARISKAAEVDAELQFGREMFFTSACARANAQELRELADMLPAMSPADPSDWLLEGSGFDECIVAYATAVFRLEVEKLQRRPSKLKLPAPKASPPESLASAPKQFRDAWLAWHAVIQPFEALKEAAKTAPEENKASGPKQHIALLQKLAPAPEPELWRELLRQEAQQEQDMARIERGVSEYAQRARFRGIVVSLLADGRLAEAVGAACSQLRDEEDIDMDLAPKPYASLLRDFLIALGLDWELIYFGFLLAERAPGADDATSLDETEAWQTLGALGSARGVRLGLEWIRREEMDSEQAFPFLLRALGPGPRNPEPLADVQPERRSALPAKARAEALAAAARFLDPKRPLEELNAAVSAIPDWLAKDLRVPLKKLLAHRNHVIAARSRDLLVKAGIATPRTKIAPAPAPIRLRVILDGEPLKNAAVKVAGEGLDEKEVTTSADGGLNIPLNEVLDPEELAEVKVWMGPGGREVVSSTVDEDAKDARNARPEVWPGPWFDFTVPVPIRDDRERELSAETGELEVGLKGKNGVPAETEVKVYLQRDDSHDGTSAQAVAKPGQSVLFQRVQVGKYRVSVLGEGVAHVSWQDARVTKAGTLKLIELQPGRIIEGSILALNGERFFLATLGKLFHDDAEVESHYSRVTGWEELPLGKYELRIPSTKELEEAARAEGESIGPFPKEHRHAAHVMEIVLTEESPPTVDLGVIQLKPEDPGAPK